MTVMVTLLVVLVLVQGYLQMVTRFRLDQLERDAKYQHDAVVRELTRLSKRVRKAEGVTEWPTS